MEKKMIKHLPIVATIVLFFGGILLLITAPGVLFGVFEQAPDRSLLGLSNQQHVQLTLYFLIAVVVFAGAAIFYDALHNPTHSNETKAD